MRPAPRARRRACSSRVDLPMPGSPASSTAPPATMPPPSTRSRAGSPLGKRTTADLVDLRASGTRAALAALGPARGAWGSGVTSSAKRRPGLALRAAAQPFRRARGRRPGRRRGVRALLKIGSRLVAGARAPLPLAVIPSAARDLERSVLRHLRDPSTAGGLAAALRSG